MFVSLIQLLSAMVSKLGNMDDPLPQESFEGVDEEEWVSNCGTFFKLNTKKCILSGRPTQSNT